MSIDLDHGDAHSLFFDPTGTRMYYVGRDAERAYSYSLDATSELIDTDNNVQSGTDATHIWDDTDNRLYYEWFVTASDGTTSTTSDTWSFTTVYTSTTAPSGYSVAWDTDAVNAGNETAVGFAISDGEDGAGYDWTISDGTDQLTGNGTMSGTSASITDVDVSGLNDGTLTVSVTLTDEAGNEGAEASDDVTKNTTAPTISAVSLGNDGSDNLSLSFDSDTQLGGATGDVSVSVDGPNTADVASFDRDDFTETEEGGTWTYTLDVDPAVAYGDGDGEYTASIDDAKDAAGNDGADGTDSDTYTLDTTAPAGYTVAWDTDAVNAGNETAAGFTISDGEVGADYEYTITSDGGGGEVSDSGEMTDGDSQAITGVDVSSLPDGTLTVSVTLSDGAGNEGAAKTADIEKDTEAPTISGVSLGNDGSDNLSLSFDSDSQLGGATGDVSVSASGPTNGTGWPVSFDRDDFDESGSGPYTYTLNVTQAYGDGDGEYTASIDDAKDAAGNDGATDESDTYTLDTTAPEITSINIVGTPDEDATSIKYEVTFTESISDFSQDGFDLITTGNATGTIDSFTGSEDTYTIIINDLDGVGSVRVDFTAASSNVEDEAGNAIGEDFQGEDHTVEVTGEIANNESDIEADPEEVTVGENSTIRLTLRDSNENLIYGFADDLELTLLGDAKVETAFAETGTETGVYEAVITNETAEQITATAGIVDGDAIGEVDVSFTTADIFADNSEFAADPTSLTVGEESILTVILRDEFNNAVSGVTGFDITLNGDATVTDEITEEGEEPGTYRFTITNTTAEEIDVNLSADEVEIGGTAIEFLPDTLTASESSVTVDPDSVTAGQNSTITIILRDAEDNRIMGVSEDEFELSLGETGAFIEEDSFEESENGEYTFTVTNETAEVVTVAATVLEITLDDKPEVTFMAGRPLAANTAAEVPNGTAGEETLITITVSDKFGNTVEGAEDYLDVVLTGANKDAELGEIKDEGDGKYTIAYIPQLIGDDLFEISLSDEEIEDSPLTSTVSAGEVDDLVIVLGNEQEGAAGIELEDPLVVKLLDNFENPVKDREITFEVTSSPDDTDSYELSAETVETDEDGTAELTFTLGTLPGEYTVKAEYDELSVEFELTAIAGPAAKIEKISGDDQTQPTRSVLEDSLIVQIFDEFDNPVPNSNVYFSFAQTPDNALDQSATPDTVSTDSGGYAKSEVRLGSEDGDYIVEASVDNEDADVVSFSLGATFTAPDPAFVDTVNTVVFSGGLESYMFAEFDESLDQTKGMTYETWVLPSSLNSNGHISKRWNSDDLSNSQYRIHIEGNLLTVELMDDEGDRYTIEIDDFFRVTGDDDTENGENNFTASAVMEANNENGDEDNASEFSWTHISLVADPNNESISVYRDGFEMERRLLNSELQSSDEQMEVGVGFDGEIHEVRLWSRPRSGRDIQAMKDLILTGSEEDLVLYHTFDEDTGDVAADLTNFENDFYFSDDVERRRSLRNVTRVTVNQDSDFIVRLAALDATGGTVTAEVLDLPKNSSLFQLDDDLEPTDEVTGQGAVITDSFNRSMYIPEREFAGVDSIQYNIYDQYGNFTTSTMVFEVLEVNRPPVVSPELSKIEFYQRETFEVLLDTVVTDNFYTPEEIIWSIEMTDSRFDWEITSDGDIKQKKATQEPDKPLRDPQRSGREFDNDGKQPLVERGTDLSGENRRDPVEILARAQGISRDDLTPELISELLHDAYAGNTEEERLLIDFNEDERVLTFTTTPLFEDEDIELRLNAVDPEGLFGRRDFQVTVNYQNDPPSPVDLLSPVNHDSVQVNLVRFDWSESTTIENDDILYTLIIDRRDGEQLMMEELADTTFTFENRTDFFTEDMEYEWRVIASDGKDETPSSEEFAFITLDLPEKYALFQNYPNPYSYSTKIEYWIPVRSDVRMEIYDTIGRRVQVLFDESGVSPGIYTADFDGAGLASGIYFYRIIAVGDNGSQFQKVKQMTLIR